MVKNENFHTTKALEHYSFNKERQMKYLVAGVFLIAQSKIELNHYMENLQNGASRRDFLKAGTVLTTGLLLSPYSLFAEASYGNEYSYDFFKRFSVKG